MQFQGAPSQGTGLSRESGGCQAFLGAALLGHGAVPSLAMGVASQEGLILTCHRHQFPQAAMVAESIPSQMLGSVPPAPI